MSQKIHLISFGEDGRVLFQLGRRLSPKEAGSYFRDVLHLTEFGKSRDLRPLVERNGREAIELVKAVTAMPAANKTEFAFRAPPDAVMRFLGRDASIIGRPVGCGETTEGFVSHASSSKHHGRFAHPRQLAEIGRVWRPEVIRGYRRRATLADRATRS
jgi:hypothetical protein